MKRKLNQESTKAGKVGAIDRNRLHARPIIFGTEMARAILDGRKTQTRRIIKPQPETAAALGDGVFSLCYPGMIWRPSPYGRPGDRLWVREAFWLKDGYMPRYKADNPHWKDVRWTPSIHMPRYLSRITLEITEIRVERIREISGDDAVTEGVTYPVAPSEKHPGKCSVLWNISSEFSPLNYIAKKDQGDHAKIMRAHFAALWDELNFKRGYGWKANPWVWVIEFQRFSSVPSV